MNKLAFLTLCVGSLFCAPVYAAKPYIETGADAEMSFDGLYRVKRSRVDAAWVREDLDLSGYNKLMVKGLGIAYRAVDWTGSARTAARRGETDFPITEENRAKLSKLFREEMLEEVAKNNRYSLSTTPGEDVLLLIGGLIDVVSHVPPEEIGRSRTFLRSVGEATMVLELRDSLTGAILARAVDRRSASTFAHESSPGINRQDVKRLASSWGKLLRDRLDDVVSISREGKLTGN